MIVCVSIIPVHGIPGSFMIGYDCGSQHQTQVACAHLSDGTARQVTLRETRVMSGDDARGE